VDATVTVFNDNVLQQLSWNRCININFIRHRCCQPLCITIFIYLFIYFIYHCCKMSVCS